VILVLLKLDRSILGGLAFRRGELDWRAESGWLGRNSRLIETQSDVFEFRSNPERITVPHGMADLV
jgi:hypothetical protein